MPQGHSKPQVEAGIRAAGSLILQMKRQYARSYFESIFDCARHQDAHQGTETVSCSELHLFCSHEPAEINEFTHAGRLLLVQVYPCAAAAPARGPARRSAGLH